MKAPPQPHIPRRLLHEEGMTSRQWKQHKRYVLRIFQRMFEKNVRPGIAYTPAYGAFNRLERAIVEARKALTVKNWGN